MAQNLKSKSIICERCKGKHWNPNSQAKTQEAVLKEYGQIANNCVNGHGGVSLSFLFYVKNINIL